MLGIADRRPERLLELSFVLIFRRNPECAGDFMAVIGPHHVGHHIEFGCARLHFCDEGVEKLVGVGIPGEQDEIDEIGVPGQLRGKPFVGFLAELQDVEIAVGDVFQGDEHLGQRDLEFRIVAADGDVVGIDVFEIVVLVDARGEECAGQNR